MLHHIELYVSNLGKSTAFYHQLLVKHLGYQVYQEWSLGISFKRDKTYLVLVQTEEKHLTPPYHRKRTGLNHLAFWVHDAAQLDTIQKELIESGVQILYPDKPRDANGYQAIYFEDPDRIKLELVYDPD